MVVEGRAEKWGMDVRMVVGVVVEDGAGEISCSGWLGELGAGYRFLYAALFASSALRSRRSATRGA